MEKYAGKMKRVYIASSFCILTIMLATCLPNFAVVACSTCVLNRIFRVGAAGFSLSSSMRLCYCSGGKPDVTDYVVTAKVANITCKELDNPAV